MNSPPVRHLLTGLIAAVVLGVGPAARAEPQVYAYRVAHALYGNIGTYTNVVEEAGDEARVQTHMDIVVKLLGIVVHRQAAERREDWEHGRLTLFRGVTETNGQKVEVAGEAAGNAFVIQSPLGRILAPANVYPTNPWSAAILSTDTVMSTKSGRLFSVHIGRESAETVIVDGKPLRLRQYDIQGDKRQFIWLDDRGVPLAFRTEEGGSMVDFVLTRYPSGEPQNWPGPEKPALPGDGTFLQQAGTGY